MPFPFNSVLDAFNRANEGPPPSANWTGTVVTGDGSFTVNTNEAAPTSGVVSSAWWNVSTFGPDCEVYATIIGAAGSIGLHLRLASPGTASVDCYTILAYRPTNELYMYRVDDGTQTQLGAAISQTLAGGDSFGATMIGSIITPYYKVGAGSWSALSTRTDGTYTAAGYIGIRAIDSTSARLDDFGGGTIITSEGRILINKLRPAIFKPGLPR